MEEGHSPVSYSPVACRTFNDIALAVGRVLAVATLALITIVILAQVFFLYITGGALNWSEEGARCGG